MAGARDELKEAKQKLQAYDVEIEKLERHLSVLKAKRERLAKSIQLIESETADLSIETLGLAPEASNLSIKEKILRVLGAAEREGMETADIKAAMEQAWPGEEINTSSLRTNLSLLHGAEKKITRSSKKWRLISP